RRWCSCWLRAPRPLPPPRRCAWIRPEPSVRSSLGDTLRAVPEYLAGFADFSGVEPWAGLRPASPDGLPIIGRSRRVSNLIVATGHGMLGMTQGPATGELVARIVCDEPASIDLAPLRL